MELNPALLTAAEKLPPMDIADLSTSNSTVSTTGTADHTGRLTVMDMIVTDNMTANRSLFQLLVSARLMVPT